MRRLLLLVLLLAAPAWGEKLTLQEARREAVQASHVLRDYRARLAEAGFRIQEAEAGGYPTLTATANTNYLTPTLAIAPGGIPIQITENHNFNVGVTLRQAIYTFGRLEWSTEAAELSARASHQELRREENRLVEEVTLAYCEVLRARERLSVAQANLQSREAHLQ
ncbi:MAG: TolC family protein, partial [Candidatus Eremiobacterota bacterium]